MYFSAVCKSWMTCATNHSLEQHQLNEDEQDELQLPPDF